MSRRRAPQTDSPASTRPSLVARVGRNVVALGVVSLFTDLSSEMIYPLLPVFLAGTLGATATMIGLIEGAAESLSGLLKYLSGWWSDKIQRRKPLVVLGYSVASIARPLVAFVQSAPQLLAIRLTDRVGKGIRTSPRDALIADSVDASSRGLAFGFHRSADHLGAVLGPLVAFALLTWFALELRTVFLLASVPAALAVAVLVVGVKEVRREPGTDRVPIQANPSRSLAGLGSHFWLVMAAIFFFTLGASTDAFLLLRASQLGVPIAQLPILWAFLHVVKSATSVPGGALSDRVGRLHVILAGYGLYAVVYLGFSLAANSWHIWLLFAVYGCFFGLTEGTEKALVADLVPSTRRGAAFGAYNLAISAGALPASLIFGLIWDRTGAALAFQFGALIAAISAVALWLVMRAPNARAATRSS